MIGGSSFQLDLVTDPPVEVSDSEEVLGNGS